MNSQSTNFRFRRLSVWLTDARFHFCVLFLVLFLPGVASAAEGLPEIAGLRLGFADQFKVGEWTPAAVELQGSAESIRGRIEITALDADGVPARIVWKQGPPATVPAGDTATVRTLVKLGRRQSSVTVEFVVEDGRRVSRTFSSDDLPPAAPADQMIFLALGDDLDLADALNRRYRGDQAQAVLGRIDDARDLPHVWLAYAGVDTVTLTTAASDICDVMTDAQIAALDEWVLLGGRLIISVGSRGTELLGDGGRWNRFVPGRFLHVTTLRETTGLESAISAGRLGAAGDDMRTDVQAAVVTDVDGRVHLYEGTLRPGRPIMIRSAHGLGQVVFVCVDLDRPPLVDWKGRPQLVDQLLDRATQSRDATGDDYSSGRAAHLGYTDLIGQVRAALDQFVGVQVIPFSVIGGLAVLYIALIGPLDYFFLRRFARRMEWTWLTFSLIALLFCGIAWGIAIWSKGRDLRLNQLAIVDVDVQQQVVRGNVWAHVYTPHASLLDLELDVDPGTDPRGLDAPSVVRTSQDAADNDSRNRLPTGQGRGGASRGELLAWLGLPGNALGGMDTVARTDLLPKTYELLGTERAGLDMQLTVSQMPLNQASSKSLVGRWWGAGNFASPGTLQANDIGMLSGQLTNPLPINLTDCTLLSDRWAYSLRNVAAGQQVSLDATLAPRNVETLLQRRRMEDLKDVTTPWDQSDTRVPRIVQMLMFHEAAGGRGYTGLTHRYQGQIDLSDHLNTERAVLVGRASEPAVRLNVDSGPVEDNGSNKHWTYYRIVFPVVRSPSE